MVNYDYYNNGWLENVRQVVNATEQKFNYIYDDGGRRRFLKYFKGTDTNPTTQTTYKGKRGQVFNLAILI